MRTPEPSVTPRLFRISKPTTFSQLFESIVQLPGFASGSSYLAYLAPGQVVFAAFLAVAWSGFGLLIEYRSGYMDKLRSMPIRHRIPVALGFLSPAIAIVGAWWVPPLLLWSLWTQVQYDLELPRG